MACFPLSEDKSGPWISPPFATKVNSFTFPYAIYISLVLDLTYVFSITCHLPTVIGLLSPWMTPIIERWWNLHILICFSSGNSGLRNGNEQKFLEVFRHLKLCKRLAFHIAWCTTAWKWTVGIWSLLVYLVTSYLKLCAQETPDWSLAVQQRLFPLRHRHFFYSGTFLI